MLQLSAAQGLPQPEALLRVLLEEVGTHEVAGSASNPRIDEYLSTVGLSSDETPWCAAFVNWGLKQIGVPGTGAPNARSFLLWGEEIQLADIRPGDIVVYARGTAAWQGHVNVFVEFASPELGWRGGLVCVGGNQSNAVTKQVYTTEKLLGVRRIKRARDSKTLIATGAIGALVAAKQAVDTVSDTVSVVNSTVNTISTAVEQTRSTAEVIKQAVPAREAPPAQPDKVPSPANQNEFVTVIEHEPQTSPGGAQGVVPGVANSTISVVLLGLIFVALGIIAYERIKKLREGR